MTFSELLAAEPAILAEGSVIERLRRDPAIPLDPHLLHAGWVAEPDGRAALERLYREYLDVGRAHALPMLILTPTWRASIDRVRAAIATGTTGMATAGAIVVGTAAGGGAAAPDAAAVMRRLNQAGCTFLQDLRATYGTYASSVFVGGLLGPRGDAYDPRDALPADEAETYHRGQAEALAAAGVDVLVAATLPAFSEALGIARALASTRAPYMLSFVLRPEGTLLDGTSLHEAIERIDGATDPPPLGYLINCVHPRVFMEACTRELAHAPRLRDRLLGLQANTSDLSPEALEGRETLVGDDPDPFADAMLRANSQLGIKLLGGCCGTNARHIEAIAKRLPIGRHP
jgi:homocysteine S-methyltransferase